jgi:hypothetical protein
MAEAKTADKPAEKKKDGKGKKPGKKAGGGFAARFTGMYTAAGCAAGLMGLFLLLLVVGVWIVFWLEPGNIPWRHSMSWWRITIELLLVIAIPLVLYQAIRLWLEGEPSTFPDHRFGRPAPGRRHPASRRLIAAGARPARRACPFAVVCRARGNLSGRE